MRLRTSAVKQCISRRPSSSVPRPQKQEAPNSRLMPPVSKTQLKVDAAAYLAGP